MSDSEAFYSSKNRYLFYLKNLNTSSIVASDAASQVQTNLATNVVKRSHSLKSLRSYNRLNNSHTNKNIFSADNSHRNSSNSSISSSDSFQLPPELMASLEKSMLHRNLKRDSFQSRRGTKHFVLNPIFDERLEK